MSEFFTRNALHRAIAEWVRPVDADWRPSPWPFAFARSFRMFLRGSPRHRSVPLAHTAAKVGPIDFARLVLTKGIELEPLREDETPDQGGTVQYGYRRS